MLHDVLANPFVAGALAGVMSAAAVDLQAFRTWKSFDDAHNYAWKVAAWRWFQGAVIGLLGALGMSGLSGMVQ